MNRENREIEFYVCEEMQKLRKLLDEKHIEWRDVSEKNWWFWICRTHFEYGDYHWSVIHGYGTYGGINMFSGKDEKRLEMMSNKVNGSEPIGRLKANDVMDYVLEKEEQ